MVEFVILETDRLQLRPWCESDREPFAALNADPEVMKFYPAVLTRQESDALVDRIQSKFDERGWGLFAVELKSENQTEVGRPQPGFDQIEAETSSGPFIGYVGLSVPRFETHFTPCVEIGWRLARSFWGSGYATEAAKRVRQFAFEQLRLPEIVSFTSVLNQPSRRVMERIGMSRDPADDFAHPTLPEGHRLRPHVLYRLQNSMPTVSNEPTFVV